MSCCATTPSAGNKSSTFIGGIGAPTTPLRIAKNIAVARNWCFGERPILEIYIWSDTTWQIGERCVDELFKPGSKRIEMEEV